MRDIRDDLRERLRQLEAKEDRRRESYNSERLRLESEYQRDQALFQEERAALLTIINLENEKLGTAGRHAVLQKSAPSLSLADFFVTTVFSKGPMTKEELRERADAVGYFDDKESAGRTTHMTLKNITVAKRLTVLPDGRYAHPSAEGLIGATGDDLRRLGIIPPHARVIGEASPPEPSLLDENSFN